MSEKNKKMFSWMSSKLEMRKARNIGNGVFARNGIKKDELLAIFGGYIMSINDELKLPKGVNDYGLQINEGFVMGPTKISEICDTDFFNHNCNPNAGFHGQLFLVAMRDIKKNEEVTFDYAMVLHKAKEVNAYKMKCLCGIKNCRKYITEDDWKKSELQKRYNGYFQYYLQEKINKLNNK